MIIKRPANERGYFDFGWLKTAHTFSFADYYNPAHVGFRHLRVINQDIVAPGQGFGMHRHHNMEIITYVIRGAVAHQDNMGNKTVINAGEIQCMSAGMGVAHSEFNPSNVEELEFLQIWVLPSEIDLVPSYQQKKFTHDQAGWQLLVSSAQEENALLIHQDIKLYRGYFKNTEKLSYSLTTHRYVWLQVVSGHLKLNEIALKAGDGASVSNEALFNLEFLADTEILLFDLN